MLTALTPLLGAYMARVYRGERALLTPVLAPVERRHVPAAAGGPEQPSQDWKSYAAARSSSRGVFWIALYVILRTQGIHPFNPEGFDSAPWDVTFNTTSSFISNTNWQYYGGETTMTYFSQMAGLAVQNFISAAVGIAVAVAVIRGFVAARAATSLGNFWQDLTRTLLYVLLPISFVGGALPRLPGRHPDAPRYATYTTVRRRDQTLALGPGGLAGGDQAARHQRRRLLQRQQRDAVREPERPRRTSSRCC